MIECAEQFDGVQVVKVNSSVETASHEQAHLVVDENGGDLPIVIVQLTEDEPFGSNWTTFAFRNILLWAVCLSIDWTFEIRILPYNDFTTLWSSNENLFASINSHGGYRWLMGSEFTIFITCCIDLWEDNTTIPVATSDHILAFVDDEDRLVKLFDAPVDLVKAWLYSNRVEFKFSITSQRKWCCWVQIMGTR